MSGCPSHKLIVYVRACSLSLLLLAIRAYGQPAKRGPSQKPPATINPAATQNANPLSTDTLISADLAYTGILEDLSDRTGLYFCPTRKIAPEQLPFLPFHRGTRKYEHFIAPIHVNGKTILRFTLTNSSDQPTNVFFCPGFLIDTIQLYRMSGIQPVSPVQLPSGDQTLQAGRPAATFQAGLPAATFQAGLPLAAVQPDPKIQRIADILPDHPDSLGYRKITLQPHDTSTWFAVLSFIKASSNSINPSLTRDTLISQAILINHSNKTSINIITNLFAGIMLMMIFYAVSEYMQSAKPEFLYYIGYSLCISILLFLKSTLHDTTTRFNFFFESFLDNIIFSLGYICYIVFHRKFLETKKNFRTLDRYLLWGSLAITTLMILYILFFFLSSDFRIANNIEVSTKILLLVISIVFIVKGLQYRNQLMNYIVMGNISLCLLSIISQTIISTNLKPVKGVSVLNLALFYYEAGITIELLFFLFALTYKNRMEIILSIQKEEKSKLESERKEMEKQVAVMAAKQDERNRISIDMHDELGSGVTAIRLMSEIVKSKMKNDTLPEIEKISNSANELLNKMNTIIWTMTSSNDTLENMVAYIRSYAVEFFENTAIDCIFSMPATIPARELSGEKRRNIFLCVKEALNNVLKHSQSRVVNINISIHDRLIIEIQDDGIGINMEKLRKFGNGLNNMKKRMGSINGEFNIENREGTRTTFFLAL